MTSLKSNAQLHCIHYIPRVYLEGGGVVRFVLDICQVLSNQGVKVTLVTTETTDVPSHWFTQDEQPDVVQIKKIPGGLITRDSLRKVSELFTENTVMNFHIPWILANFQLARLANKHGIPYIVTPHGSLDTWSVAQKRLKKEIFWFCFGRKHYRDAKFIHYTAEGERDQGEKYILKDETRIIPCLFDASEFRDLPSESLAREKFPQISTDKPNLLFLSRLHPKKGPDILVNAAKILFDKGVKFNILLAGPEDHTVKEFGPQLKNQIESMGLADSVHLIGMVKGEEKLSLYRLSDIFVLPTHQENFGFVLVEAMACGTSVITSYGVDIWREIQRGGATITDNNPQLIAAEIEKSLSDPERLKKTGIQCRDWVLSEFDSAKLAADYTRMYLDSVDC